MRARHDVGHGAEAELAGRARRRAYPPTLAGSRRPVLPVVAPYPRRNTRRSVTENAAISVTSRGHTVRRRPPPFMRGSSPPLTGAELRPAQGVGAGHPILAAAHMQQPLPQIQLLAPQADQFRDAEPVPVGEQDHGGIALTVTSDPLCRCDQPVDFRRRQMLPASPIGVGDLGRRPHGTNFPENDVWHDLRRRAVTQAAPWAGAAYLPEKVPYRESSTHFHPHNALEHRSTDARRQQQAADRAVASRASRALRLA